MQNIIGNRGEYIFAELITEKTDDGYLFNPAFLGEKWPTSDFYVELFKTDKPMFCFFQIKSTSNGYTKKENKLKANITKDDLIKLSNLPAPSYVIGIDEQEKKGFIISTNGIAIKAINTLPTKHPINEENIKKLWKEVKGFWENSKNNDYKDNDFSSNFNI
jgi:hypothetical protein